MGRVILTFSQTGDEVKPLSGYELVTPFRPEVYGLWNRGKQGFPWVGGGIQAQALASKTVVQCSEEQKSIVASQFRKGSWIDLSEVNGVIISTYKRLRNKVKMPWCWTEVAWCVYYTLVIILNTFCKFNIFFYACFAIATLGSQLFCRPFALLFVLLVGYDTFSVAHPAIYFAFQPSKVFFPPCGLFGTREYLGW